MEEEVASEETKLAVHRTNMKGLEFGVFSYISVPGFVICLWVVAMEASYIACWSLTQHINFSKFISQHTIATVQ